MIISKQTAKKEELNECRKKLETKNKKRKGDGSENYD
jgi:hypothetical protein